MFNQLEKHNFGGTVIETFVDGHEVTLIGYRHTGTVDVYDCTNSMIASCNLDDTFETATICYLHQPMTTSSTIYHEHNGKTEYDLALDLGTWLAVTHPG